MGLLNSMINILGKTVAQGVGSVVEKAVSEAVKPAVNLFHVDDDACEMILIFYQESREEFFEAAKL